MDIDDELLAEATIEKMPFEALGWVLSVLANDPNSTTEVQAILHFLNNRTTETAATAALSASTRADSSATSLAITRIDSRLRSNRSAKVPRHSVRVTGLVITENEFPAGNGGRYDLFPTRAYATAHDPQLEANNVCAAGGSYGGYATLAGLAFTPDLAMSLSLPMRWVTDGQDVPADVKPGSQVK